MDFDFNDEQREIKSTAHDFLASRFKPEKVRELAESDNPYDEALWSEISELGWPGIAISEEYGGQGLGAVELVILQEELGYVCAPTPLISNAYAGAVIEAAGSDEQKQRWLPGIASGEARGAAELTADPDPIVGAAGGSAVLVLADGEGAKLVETATATLERLDLIDTTRAYFRVSADGGDPLPGEVEGAVDTGTVALAAELVGVAQRALDMSVDYAKEREQFERPIGAYQAVSHRLAGMLWDVEEARSLVYYAAWCADAEPESLALAASMAKARASDAATSVTHDAIQTFGGIGFTWEHDVHFLLKRARVGAELLGTARQHRERVADLVGLAETTGRAGLIGQDLDVRGELGLAAEPVLDVDGLVLAVCTEEAEVHRHPASRRHRLLDDRPGEHHLTAPDPIVGALGLLDPVHIDPDRPLGAARQAHAAARGVAALRDLDFLRLHPRSA